jgi:hypothetical protein
VKARIVVILSLLAIISRAHGDGAGDNIPDKVRRIPPPGIAVPAADRAELTAGIDALGKEIEALKEALKDRPTLRALLPDVQIYHNAVRYALKYDEFFQPGEIAVAKAHLKQGMERAQALRAGKAPWATGTGLVVRGYVSRIDGSVQPYGLVVPASYNPDTPYRHRLDIWFHGRGETLSEVNFIDGRQRSPGEFTPPHTFVLHPYGRYCNANKFAGEIDLLEAFDHVRTHYPIDDNRVLVRGFSMGGAACWQFATHYASMWAGAAPGAGFSETPDFLKVFQKETLQPTWYEKKLWHLYDCTDYALNLFNCPVVAYSGANDIQKQAADQMEKALAWEGIKLVHLIGPGTGHSYHPAIKDEISRRMDRIAGRGRNPIPAHVRLATWTLRYNRMFWITVDGLEHHWERARVLADVIGVNRIKVDTANVSALTFFMPAGMCPLDVSQVPHIILDGQQLDAAPVLSDRSWTAHFRKNGAEWASAPDADDGTLRKRHGLQGPIDDAFMDSFLMVFPSGKPFHDKVGAWVQTESKHAIEHWRWQFRGDARVRKDSAVTDADIASHNLVLWGDPSSNQVMAKVAESLPIRWTKEGIFLRDKQYPVDHHALVMIFPNPLNPKRYVVLNSGFTYREYDYLNNARQVPKLPDFAVVDVSVAPTSRAPGGIAAAGFFGEGWELPAENPK